VKIALNAWRPARVVLSDVATEDLALSILTRTADPNRGFERLLEAHERMVTGTAYRILGRMEDAQDAAQEVFLRLYRHLDRIEGDIKPWLYRVTVNVCNDYYRRRRVTTELDEAHADTAPGPDHELRMDERRRLLMEGLQTLPERERTAVVLREIEGLSTRQVAEALGVEEATVRSQISVARVKLAKYVRGRK
jgi:RNA polymerase sigma-70 factor (ECF subfamily)